MTQPSPTSLPSENVQRGVTFALLVLPLGVIAWDILWGVGFVASIVAFGMAYLAVRLYRFGSGGRITRSGAIAITVITIGTLVVAFVSGFAVDLVSEYSRITGQSIPEALVSSRFWGIVFAAMTSGQALISLLLAAVFGALGCFGILRGAFRQTRLVSQPTNPEGTPAVPSAPAPAPGLTLNGEAIPPAADESRDDT